MKQIYYKLIQQITEQILNTEIGKDGKYQQLVKQKEQLELSFYRSEGK